MNGISDNRCIKMYDDINVYNQNQIYYGCGNITDAGKYSNRVGSVELPTRTCAILHSEKNYSGDFKILCNYSFTRNKIYDRLSSNIDNKMNSIKVFELKEV